MAVVVERGDENHNSSVSSSNRGSGGDAKNASLSSEVSTTTYRASWFGEKISADI
jgi:hypothetical protein